jgi:hypothetical protein
MGYQLLVAVKSCHRDRKAGFHDAIRGTWGKDLGTNVNLRFFMGANPDPRESTGFKSDEVVLDCPDDYMSLPFKTREICAWQHSRMINYTYLCDNDTIVRAKPLLALPYQQYDYSGHFGNEQALDQTFNYQDAHGVFPECFPWASGGWGYFLSKDAALEVAEAFPTHSWAEDMYVGNVIGPQVQKGFLTSARLEMSNVVDHFRKSRKFPVFTPELLYRAYKEGGVEQIYAEARSAK